MSCAQVAFLSFVSDGTGYTGIIGILLFKASPLGVLPHAQITRAQITHVRKHCCVARVSSSTTEATTLSHTLHANTTTHTHTNAHAP